MTNINKVQLVSTSGPDLSPDKLEYDQAMLQVELKMRKLLQTAPPLIRRQTSHLAKATGKGSAPGHYWLVPWGVTT